MKFSRSRIIVGCRRQINVRDVYAICSTRLQIVWDVPLRSRLLLSKIIGQVSEGKHAFLILAHQDEAMLRRLVARIAPLGPVYVHVDAKSDMSGWQTDNFACNFLTRRVPVYWGNWSMVEATTLLLETALSENSNVRFTLLSGSHYPIISNAEIQESAQFAGNLIASRSAPNMPDGSRPESEYERRYYRTRNPNGTWSVIKNGFMNRLVFYHRPLEWTAVAPDSGMRAGSQFWSIEREFAEYCVSRIRTPTPLIDYFKKIVCSDEKIFATLYGEFSNAFLPEGTTYAKWAGGANPVPISLEDIQSALKKYPFWFARKFDSRDSSILDSLDQL